MSVSTNTLNDKDISITLTQPVITNVETLTNSIDLTWTSVTGASNYIVEAKESGNSNFDIHSILTANTYELTGLTTGVEYDIRVSANVTPALYVAVATYYNSSNTNTYSSIEVSKANYPITNDIQTVSSANTSATPQETIAFPNLPNNGGGCLLRRNF